MKSSSHNVGSKQCADNWNNLLENTVKRKEQVIGNTKIIAYFIYIFKSYSVCKASTKSVSAKKILTD